MPSYLLTKKTKLGEVAGYAGFISTVIHRFGDRLSFSSNSAIYPFKARLSKGGWIYALRFSRFGLAVRRSAGKQKDLGSNLLRLSFHFKSCGLWTLSCDFVPHNYETLKWISSLPALIIMQE